MVEEVCSILFQKAKRRLVAMKFSLTYIFLTAELPTEEWISLWCGELSVAFWSVLV